MQIHASPDSFAERIPAIFWMEGYTVTDSGIPIIAWNGAETIALYALRAPGILEELCPFDTPNQSGPVSSGECVAFFAEDPAHENDLRLYIYNLESRELKCPPLASSPRPRSVAWVDHEHLITVNPVHGGADLVLVSVTGEDKPRSLLTLPGGEYWIDPAPSISINGHVLLVVRAEQGQHLVRLELQSGKVSTLLRGNKGAMPLGGSWSPSGNQIICLVRRAQKLAAVLLDVEKGTMESLDVPPLKALPTWHPNEHQLLLTLDAWPTTELIIYDLRTHRLSSFPSPAGHMTSTPYWRGATCYFAAYAPDCPPSLWCWDTLSDQVTLLTPTFSVPALLLPKTLALPTPQGFNLPCLLYEPIHEHIRGVVLMLHGGPSSCWRVGWDPVTLALSAAGYRVIMVNTRGSNFRLWPIPSLLPGEFGHADVEDIGTCLEQLQRLGLAEAGKISIIGHSYGAFLAYRAASCYPVQISALVLTSGYLRPEDLLESKDPEVQRFYRYAFSSNVQQGESSEAILLPCPTLMVHGEHDAQVSISTAITNEDRMYGQDHQLLILSGEGHAYRRKENIARWVEAALMFLDAHRAE